MENVIKTLFEIGKVPDCGITVVREIVSIYELFRYLKMTKDIQIRS
jgi:hypothetical protein